jgi:tetratricopeptide (TPR) repeat protein
VKTDKEVYSMTSDSGHEEKGIELVDLSVDDPSVSFSIQPVQLKEEEEKFALPPPLPDQELQAELTPAPISPLVMPAPVFSPDPSKTKIDLGDDLLEEKTIVVSGIPEGLATQNDPHALEASVQNARILLSEGFPEEAKKILRQILLQNKNNVESQKLLEEIHHSELKQIFLVAEPSTRKNYTGGKNTYDESILNVDAEKLLKSLDEEFDLGLDPSRSQIFFSQELETSSPAPSDRIDLAISFIEMELYAHANQLLRAVLRTENSSTLTAVALLAYSHLLSGQYFEVLSVLQPYINDTEVLKEDKIEFFYLMGRANHALARTSEALGWFLYVESIDPSYRDNAERVKQLKK